ncbi:MAG: fumarylacetoacetate hydrolase family protein [Dehalococcoidia bacterium]
MIREADIQAAADALYAARRDRRPIEPLSASLDSLTVSDAYAIQSHFVDRLMTDGGRIVGHKIGLSSVAMQHLLGVDEPDYGPVLSSMVFDDGQEIPLDQYCQPKIEAEIAMVLESPLEGPGVTPERAAGSVGGAVAALELVDSRIADWKITLVDTIADLASSAAIVLGSDAVPLDGSWDPRLTGMIVRRNGEIVDTGVGAAALGDPLNAVAWLANTLASYGVRLEAGHVIMTGSLHAAFDLDPGDEVVAEFDRLGSVGCRFL